MPSPDPISFNPTPETADAIFRWFYDPTTSLADIASRSNTTLEALSAWMARPDIAERMNNLESAGARRLRLVASGRLFHAMEACTTILMEFNDSACHEAGIKNGRGITPSEHIRRDRETARKASQLLLRLANFHPGRPPSRLRALAGAAPTDPNRATGSPPTAATGASAQAPFDLTKLREALASCFTTTNAEPESLDTPEPTSDSPRATGSAAQRPTGASAQGSPNPAAAPARAASQAVGLIESSRGQESSNGTSAAPGEVRRDPRSLKGSNETPNHTGRTTPPQDSQSAPVGAAPPHAQSQANPNADHPDRALSNLKFEISDPVLSVLAYPHPNGYQLNGAHPRDSP